MPTHTCDKEIHWQDLSTSGYSATLTNFVPACDDSSGWNGDGTAGDPFSIAFENATDHVVVTDSFDLGADPAFTMEAWIKPDTLTDWQAFMSFGEDNTKKSIMFDFDATGILRLNLQGGYFHTSVETISAGEWVHVVVTKSPGDMNATTTFYINGQVATGAGASATTPELLPGPFTLGTAVDGGDYKFDGRIGYSAVYSDILTAGEVAQNFDALKDRFRQNPIGDLISDSLVVQLDVANAKNGFSAYTSNTNTGPWTDISGNNNHGLLSGQIGNGFGNWFSSGGVHSLEFAGTASGGDDKITLTDGDSTAFGTGDFTVETWVNLIDNAGDHVLFHNYPNSGTGFKVHVISTGVPKITVGNAAFQATSASLFGAWHHIVATRNGATVTIYVDGTPYISGGDYSAKDISNTTAGIIGMNDSGGEQLNGWMGYFSIYSRSLDQTEVTANCNALTSRYGVTCN